MSGPSDEGPVWIQPNALDEAFDRLSYPLGYLAFHRLMTEQARNGPLPNDDRQLAKLARITPAQWKRVAAEVRAEFVVVKAGAALWWPHMRHDDPYETGPAS